MILAASALVQSQAASPVAKVLQLLTDLSAKIIKQGEGAQKVYSDFSEWCRRASDAPEVTKKPTRGRPHGRRCRVRLVARPGCLFGQRVAVRSDGRVVKAVRQVQESDETYTTR